MLKKYDTPLTFKAVGMEAFKDKIKCVFFS